MRKPTVAVAALSMLLAAAPALAQKKVFRCEVGGRVTYADAPCKGGTDIAVDDARTEAQRKAAQDTVQREDRMADKMARERHARERAAATAPAHIAYPAAQRAACAVDAAARPRPKKKTVVRAAPQR